MAADTTPSAPPGPGPGSAPAPAPAPTPAPVPATAVPGAVSGTDKPSTDSDGRKSARTGREGRGGRGGHRRGGGRNRGDDKPWKKGNGGGGFGSTNKNPAASLDQREEVSSDRAAKRRKVIEAAGGDGNTYMSIQFPEEEIAAEERRPKRKVAVLFGYAGTGYHGLQINHKDKTIEGDMFAAFVAAGAISKVNADDPKKSSLVRCARTDKGVHAAGNVLSLKLIVDGIGETTGKSQAEQPQTEQPQTEQPQAEQQQAEKPQAEQPQTDQSQAEQGQGALVESINAKLPEQIRIWSILRTNNSFSAYQACDSRWYEYLIPSYALLPPNPRSYLGKKIAESAKEAQVWDQYRERLDDVADFWEEVEKNDIQPIINALEPDVKEQVLRILDAAADQELNAESLPAESEEKATAQKQHEAAAPAQESSGDGRHVEEAGGGRANGTAETPPAACDSVPSVAPDVGTAGEETGTEKTLTPVEKAVRDIKISHVQAKRRYRASLDRIARLQRALDHYLGTRNYHNYTVEKSALDPSAKRTIKSFVVEREPILIGDTEWLSLKVHGQSFMMHQIRKMVAMAVMVVRCGTSQTIIDGSYGQRRISIPKAPSLGLMLERPIFTESNKKLADLGRDPVDFSKHDDKIQAFKDKYIYKHMFAVEEETNAFHMFFNQVDNFRAGYFLWVTAGGFDAACQPGQRGSDKIPKALEAELGDEADGVVEGDS